jgi:hypothetical protein
MRSYIVTASGAVLGARVHPLPKRIAGLARRQYLLHEPVPAARRSGRLAVARQSLEADVTGDAGATLRRARPVVGGSERGRNR